MKPNAIRLKSSEQIEAIRQAGLILHGCFETIKAAAQPGVATRDLDRQAELYIRSRGGLPALKAYRRYPAAVCFSVNHEVANGLPDGYCLQSGDILSLDSSVIFQGMIADSAITIAVGDRSPEADELLSVTAEALRLGIAQARPGHSVGDISAAIFAYVNGRKLSVASDLVGHGVGHELHELPEVPNHGGPGTGERLVAGMVLAIEPIVARGAGNLVVKRNSWTLCTADKSLAAHFEHTVVITPAGPFVLTNGI